MKKISKILVVLFLCFFSLNVHAQDINDVQDEWLELSPENFPDDVFRWYLIETYDKDGNGKINPDSIYNIDYRPNIISQDDMPKIKSLEGIGYFKNIKELRLDYNDLTSVDLQENTELTYISLRYNNLSDVIIGNNKNLTQLDLFCNNIIGIDLSESIELQKLNVAINPIQILDLSNNVKLSEGSVQIDSYMKLIFNPLGVKRLYIFVPYQKGNINFNNLTNYSTEFLNNLNEEFDYEEMYYNDDTKNLCYNTGFAGLREFNGEYYTRSLYGTIEFGRINDENGFSLCINYNSDLWKDNEGYFAEYNGYKFYKESSVESYGGIGTIENIGKITCIDENGNLVKNNFVFDGVNTYYFQEDGTAMKDRLSYHPDGEHVIYFDAEGHEVFSDFANVKKTIAGEDVNDFCFFNVFGYMYVDVLTYDKTGTYLYYANPYGVMEMGKWFQFSDSVEWADGTPAEGIAGGYGYANENGTLLTNTQTVDWEGRSCYLQGNGVAAY